MPTNKTPLNFKIKKILTILKSEKSKIVFKTVILAFVLSYLTVIVCAKAEIIEIKWQFLFVPAIVVLQCVIIIAAFINRNKKI